MLLILILITIQYAIGRQLPENHIQTPKQSRLLFSDDNILSYNKKHIRVGDEISKSNNDIDEREIGRIDPDIGVVPIKKVKTNVKKPKKVPKKQPKIEQIEKISKKPKKVETPTKVKKPSKNTNHSKKELNDMMNYIKKIISEMNNEEEETVTEPGEVESEQEIPFEEMNAENSKAITNDDINIENNRPIKTGENQAIVTDDINSINNKEINTEETIPENSGLTEIEEPNSKNNKAINDEAIKSEEISTENSKSITNEEVYSENSQETINEEINAESNKVPTTNEIDEMTPDVLVTTTLKPNQIDVPTNTVDIATQTEANFNKEPASVVESTTKFDGDLSLKTELKTISQILLQMKPVDYNKMAQIYQEFLSIYKNMLKSINSLVNALTNIDKTMSENNALISTSKDQALPMQLQPTKIKINWKDKCFKVVPASGKLFTRNRKFFTNYNHVNKAYGVNRKKLIRHIEQGYLDVETQLQCINSLTSMYSEKDMFVIGYIASTAEHFEAELLKKKSKMINDLNTWSNKELFKVFDLLENSKYKLKNIEKILNETLLRNHLPPYDQTLITGQNYNIQLEQ